MSVTKNKFDLAPIQEAEPQRLLLRVDFETMVALERLKAAHMENTGRKISQEKFIEENILKPFIQAARLEGVIK